MTSVPTITKYLLSFICLLSLSGCVPVLAGGAVAGAAVVGVQERSVGNTVDDTTIWANIHARYLKENYTNLKPISITVSEGRVLLTGVVKDVTTRMKAVEIAWKPSGVKHVINELEVDQPQSTKALAKDAWITTQVKSRLLTNPDIKSVNFSVETTNQIVYLIGIGHDKEELDRVTYTASTVPGVQKVVSYIRLKNQD